MGKTLLCGFMGIFAWLFAYQGFIQAQDLLPLKTSGGQVFYGRIIDQGPDWIQAVGAGWTRKWYSSQLSPETREHCGLSDTHTTFHSDSSGLEATRAKLLQANADLTPTSLYPIGITYPTYAVSYAAQVPYWGYYPAFPTCPPRACSTGGIRISLKF